MKKQINEIEKIVEKFNKTFMGVEWGKSKDGKMFCYKADVNSFLRITLLSYRNAILEEKREKIIEIAPQILAILEEKNNQEMGETGIYEELILPLRKLTK